MRCPECDGDARVLDGVYIPDTNEKLRKLICKDCGRKFYTCESVSEHNTRFKLKWNKYYRVKGGKR